MAQDMRSQTVRPFRQVPGRGLGQAGPQRLATHPSGSAIGITALRTEQWRAEARRIVAELAPHVLDEPSQGPARAVDQRHHALAGPGTTSTFAMPDMEFAEPAQIPLDVGQVQVTRLVD